MDRFTELKDAVKKTAVKLNGSNFIWIINAASEHFRKEAARNLQIAMMMERVAATDGGLPLIPIDMHDPEKQATTWLNRYKENVAIVEFLEACRHLALYMDNIGGRSKREVTKYLLALRKL